MPRTQTRARHIRDRKQGEGVALHRLKEKFDTAAKLADMAEELAREAEEQYEAYLAGLMLLWEKEMNRRADAFWDEDNREMKRVWSYVDEIRRDLGDEYGDIADQLAAEVLAPYQQQMKSLADYKTGG